MSRNTNVPGYQLVKEKMSFMGRISRILLWGWQILIAIFFFMYMSEVSPLLNTDSDAELAGAVIGMGLSWGLIGMVWFAGTIVLGLMTLFTRPAKALLPVTQEEPMGKEIDWKE